MRSNHLDDDKYTPNFYFQVIHPDAISSENFVEDEENIKVILDDILARNSDRIILDSSKLNSLSGRRDPRTSFSEK